MRSRSLFILAVVCSLALLLPVEALAGSVPDRTVQLTQPDGTTIEAVPYGDEETNGYETVDGLTIVQAADGTWQYASLAQDGHLVPGGVVVGEAAPVVAPHMRENTAALRRAAPGRLFSAASLSPHVGSRPILVLLVEFNDHAAQTTAGAWESSFFGPSNSVRDYYDEASHGTLSMDPAPETHGTADDGIVGWLNLGSPHPNTGGTTSALNHDLTRDAINAADPFVDFSQFDVDDDDLVSLDELSVVVVAAGNETSFAGAAASCVPSLWAHQSGIGANPPIVDGVEVAGWTSGGGYTQFGEMHCDGVFNHQATIGVMVHELGHDLRLPDLYDFDGSSAGVGIWSVMGHGAWLTTGAAFGDTPSLPDAFSRVYQGWVTPTVIMEDTFDLLIGSVSSEADVIQVLENPNGVDWEFGVGSGTGEYFLVEARDRSGYDAALPACGVLIWHIDESRTSSNLANADDARRLVDLEEADGQDHLDNFVNTGDAGDPADNKFTFGSNSYPSSRLYDNTPSGVQLADIDDTCADDAHMDVLFDLTDPIGQSCDFNGDGFGDLATGVPLEDLDSNTDADAGAVNVMYGSPSGLDPGTSVLLHQGTPGVSGVTEDGDQFGIAVACGDVDADGYDDLAVGVNAEDLGTTSNAGIVQVLFGGPGGVTGSGSQVIHQDRPGIKGTSEANDFFGQALVFGFFNDDEFADLAIGIPGEDDSVGAVQVVMGSATGVSESDYLLTQISELGNNPGGAAGSSLAVVGDEAHILAIGHPGQDYTSKIARGSVSFVLFNRNGPRSAETMILGGGESGDQFGYSIAASDIDGDGHPDLAVGVPGRDVDGATNAGAVLIAYAPSGGTGWPADSDLMTQNTPGIKGVSEPGDLMGWAVAVGDVDGDTLGDVLAGVPGENNAAGAVSVMIGSLGGISTADELWTQNSSGIKGTSEAGDVMGASLALADFDDDGRLDAAIGTYGEAIGSTDDAGALNVLMGGGVGLTSIGDLFVSQNTSGVPGSSEEGDLFGYAGSGNGATASSAASPLIR